MKWITKYLYVDRNTGDTTETNKIAEEEKNNEIIIIKTEKTTRYHDYSTRVTQITKHYRRTKYTQPKIF